MEPFNLALSLFLIKTVVVGGSRYIYQVLFESSFSNVSLSHDNSDKHLSMDLHIFHIAVDGGDGGGGG